MQHLAGLVQHGLAQQPLRLGICQPRLQLAILLAERDMEAGIKRQIRRRLPLVSPLSRQIGILCHPAQQHLGETRVLAIRLLGSLANDEGSQIGATLGQCRDIGLQRRQLTAIEPAVELTLQLGQRWVSAGAFVPGLVVVDQLVQPQCGLHLRLPGGAVQHGELIQDPLIRLANRLGKYLGGFFQLIRAVGIGKQVSCPLLRHHFARQPCHWALVKHRQLQDLLQRDLVGKILGRLEACKRVPVHLGHPEEQRLAIRSRRQVVAIRHV